MDGRTKLVVGGVSAVAASLAVIGGVVLTTSAALADSAGSDIASARVVVPAADTGAAEDADGGVATVSTSRPETVLAPDPFVVDTPQAPAAPPAPPAPAQPAPQPPAPQPAPQVPASQEEAEAASAAAGTWDAVRAWAAARGWSTERVDEWIARIQERYGSNGGDRFDDGRRPDDTETRGSHGSEKFPAGAGRNDDDWWKSSGVDRDQSRESPVWRD